MIVDPKDKTREWVETEVVEVANIADPGPGNDNGNQVGIALSTEDIENVMFVYRFHSREQVEEVVQALRNAADHAWPIELSSAKRRP